MILLPSNDVSADDRRVNLYNKISNNEIPLLSKLPNLMFEERADLCQL